MANPLAAAELVANLQISTMYTVAIVVGLAAVSTGIGFALLGSKFLESSARQPEMMSQLQVKMFIIAGLLDAVPMIGVAVSLLLIFANPFMPQLQALLPN